MKGEKSLLISLIVVLALCAFVAPISAKPFSAHSITDGNVECPSGDTIWTYTVSYSESPATSNWVVFWCNPGAILDVKVDASSIPDCEAWVDEEWCYEYKTAEKPDHNTGLQGIKIEYMGSGDSPKAIPVTIKLNGCGYDESDNVDYGIKASGDIFFGTLTGPVCTPGIPEFTTIAIPVASILGLLFFFNHRKRRIE
jgi:hypothetical protein